MRNFFSSLVIAFLGAQVVAAPGDAIARALAHAVTLPPDPQRQGRYLDLTHLNPEQQADAFRALSFHLNSLSREPDIVQPVLLEGGILYFDLRDYGINHLTYVKLETPDPYYHAQIEVTEEKKDQYGRVNRSTVRKSSPAPWLPRVEYDQLCLLMNSRVPILRGDWFLFQTSIQKDRVVGYYDLLGLGNKEADFLKLVGANPSEAKRLKMETAASVSASAVALHNRAILRQQAITGGHWITLDYKTSTNKQNTSRLLAGDTEPPQGDASEQFGVLPNRLFAYWLQDAKGNRQDTAPDDIASDGRSTSTDRRVHVMLSCVRCHVEGLRPINDYVRNLFQAPLQLVSPDYDRLKRLRQLYTSDLIGQLAEDNSRFARAVWQANGTSIGENSRIYAWFWEQYADSLVTVAVAARELGCTEDKLITVIQNQVISIGVYDPVQAAFIRGLPIRREHFEEVYGQLYMMVR